MTDPALLARAIEALENAAMFLEIGAGYAPNEFMKHKLKVTGEMLSVRGLADTMRASASSARTVRDDLIAAQANAGEGWRDISTAPEWIRSSRHSRLGEHVCRTFVLPDGEIAVVDYHPTRGAPLQWIVLPPPPAERE